MKVITFVYNSVGKVSSSVSIGLLVSGIIAGTSACNRENIATVQNGSKELASSPAALKVEQIQSKNPGSSKLLPNSNLPHSSRTLTADTQAQNVQPFVEQKEDGKLRFVNDTPYMSIVYIYASAEESYIYTYVPPCTTRELYDTYSNSRLISLNGHAKFPIAKKAKREGDFFAIKMSALVDDSEQEQLCEFNPSEALDIKIPADSFNDSLSGLKAFLGGGDNLPSERILGEIVSGSKDIGLNKFKFALNQLIETVDDKVKSLADTYRNEPASVTDGIKYSDKVFQEFGQHI